MQRSATVGLIALGSFLLLTAFAGLNLLQSGFSGWCPIVPVLRRLGAVPATYPGDGRPASAALREGRT